MTMLIRCLVAMFTLLLGASLSIADGGMASVLAGPVAARVVKVLDGDSFKADAHVWPGTIVTVAIRIRGVDAPEMRSRCEQEKRLARVSRAVLGGLISNGMQLQISNVSGDKYYGRVLADITLPDGGNLGQVLLSAGSVRPYAGRARNSWCVVRGGR